MEIEWRLLFSSSSVLNVTEIVVVGGKLESNGILDDENIDDELKVFYTQSKKVDSIRLMIVSRENLSFLVVPLS